MLCITGFVDWTRQKPTNAPYTRCCTNYKYELVFSAIHVVFSFITVVAGSMLTVKIFKHTSSFDKKSNDKKIEVFLKRICELIASVTESNMLLF